MEETTEVTFSDYGRDFQRKVVQALITDQRWASQMSDVVSVGYFDYEAMRYLVDVYFQYFERYKCFPSFDGLIGIVKDDLRENDDDTLKTSVVAFLRELRSEPDVRDLPWVKEKSLDFCRKQCIKESLERIVNKVEVSEYDEVVDELKRAVNRGACESIGHDFIEDREARFVEAQRSPVPIGMPELDGPTILRGGLGRGELGCWVGTAGAGKSHALVHCGAEALLKGYNVIHYTMELSETLIGLRYDSHLTGIESNDVPLAKDEVLRLEDNMNLGRLIIKGYPTGVATIQTLRSHIERVTLQGMTPDLVIVDYADIMRSTRRYDAPRFELKLIYEELRSLAMDMNVPVWSASQSNRGGATSDIVGLENMSEAYAKAAVADVVLSLSRKPEEKATGLGRLYVAKNRAGRDGIVFPMKIDTATSLITMLDGDVLSLEQAQRASEGEQREMLRKKWAELRRDEGIPDGPVRHRADT